MSRPFNRGAYLKFIFMLWVAGAAQPGWTQASADDLAVRFEMEVQPRLHPPEDEQRRYALALLHALDQSVPGLYETQYVLLVDRAPAVQAAFLYWIGSGGEARLLGAAPVSTGLPGRFDHFVTPTGVFAHLTANPDYRALGTRNAQGIRGYGERGMRVFDFGWQQAAKGWGSKGISTMRLQMHATDPDRLEQRLGSAQSKGCIRIPASLNRFLDVHGILDADYRAADAAGVRLPVPMPVGDADHPGRFLVVMDSELPERPAWAIPRR